MMSGMAQAPVKCPCGAETYITGRLPSGYLRATCFAGHVVPQGDDPSKPPPSSPRMPSIPPVRPGGTTQPSGSWAGVWQGKSPRQIARDVIDSALSEGYSTHFELADYTVVMDLGSHPKWIQIRDEIRKIVAKEGFPPGTKSNKTPWEQATEIVDEALDQGVWGNWQLEQFIRYKRYDRRQGWYKVWGCIRRMRLPWDRYRYNPLGNWNE